MVVASTSEAFLEPAGSAACPGALDHWVLAATAPELPGLPVVVQDVPDSVASGGQPSSAEGSSDH